MASNVTIFPTGTTSNPNPHIVFEDGVDGVPLQFNVSSSGVPTLTLSSSTVANGLVISAGSVVTSGASIDNSGGLFVGGTLMVNSSGVWVGPTSGLIGPQASRHFLFL